MLALWVFIMMSTAQGQSLPLNSTAHGQSPPLNPRSTQPTPPDPQFSRMSVAMTPLTLTETPPWVRGRDHLDPSPMVASPLSPLPSGPSSPPPQGAANSSRPVSVKRDRASSDGADGSDDRESAPKRNKITEEEQTRVPLPSTTGLDQTGGGAERTHAESTASILSAQLKDPDVLPDAGDRPHALPDARVPHQAVPNARPQLLVPDADGDGSEEVLPDAASSDVLADINNAAATAGISSASSSEQSAVSTRKWEWWHDLKRGDLVERYCNDTERWLYPMLITEDADPTNDFIYTEGYAEEARPEELRPLREVPPIRRVESITASERTTTPEKSAGPEIAQPEPAFQQAVTIYFGASGENATFEFPAKVRLTVELFKRYLLLETDHGAVAETWWGAAGKPPYKLFFLIREDENCSMVEDEDGTTENFCPDLPGDAVLADGGIYRACVKWKVFDKGMDLADLQNKVCQIHVWLYQHEWMEHECFKMAAQEHQGWLWKDVFKVGHVDM